MKRRSEFSNIEPSVRDRIIGLGERSMRKSYFPQLQKQLATMECVLKELAESQDRYRTLVENINDVIFSVNTDGVLTYISPVIHNMTGYLAEEVIGKSFIRKSSFRNPLQRWYCSITSA